MKADHIVERLENLAAYRTPGRPPPTVPIPVNEHLLLREAATLLRILQADLTTCLNPGSRTNAHQRWALVDDSTKAMVGFCEGGKRAASELLQDLIDKNFPNARSIVLREIFLGDDVND